MKKIGDCTDEELRNIINGIYKSKLFFTASFEQLSRHFINDQVFKLSYLDLRRRALWLVDDSSQIPLNENDFHRHICQRYLDIEKLSTSVMLQYYQTAKNDLKTLEARIRNYEQLITDIDKKEPQLKTEEDQYKQRLLIHYKQINESAYQEILDFLFHRIEEYTIFNCTGTPWMTSLIYGGIPYSFRILSNQLQWESLSDLSNKFSDLEIQEHRKMEKLYTDDQTSFYVATGEYIEKKNIVEKIKGMIAGNHALAKRKRVFDEAFKAYSGGSKRTQKNIEYYFKRRTSYRKSKKIFCG